MAGIYVHIPFCHAKCAYCDFYSMPDAARAPQLADAVVREWEARRGEISEPVRTIYFGGGTPSSLPPELLGHILRALPTADATELTIEVNPEDVTDEAVTAWLALGFNRVSMGIQSFDDPILRTIGRRHTAAQALEAARRLRRLGFANLSCDLIYGLQGQDLGSWRSSLDTLLELHPEHISAYCLSYEPGTRLTAMLRAGKIAQADDELIANMYGHLCRATAAEGYEHYEISNFALPGRRSRHNSSYWNSTPYVGLGPAAHSFDGRVRRFNPSNLTRYLAACPAFEIDDETEQNRINDILITRLRTADGLDPAALPEPWRSEVLRSARPYLASGRLVAANGFLRIPEDIWLLSDAIIRDLLV